MDDELNLDSISKEHEILINDSSFNESVQKINENLATLSIFESPKKEDNNNNNNSNIYNNNDDLNIVNLNEEAKLFNNRISKNLEANKKTYPTSKKKYFTDLLKLINNDHISTPNIKENNKNDCLNLNTDDEFNNYKKLHAKKISNFKYSNILKEINSIGKKSPQPNKLIKYNAPPTSFKKMNKNIEMNDKYNTSYKFQTTTKFFNPTQNFSREKKRPPTPNYDILSSIGTKRSSSISNSLNKEESIENNSYTKFKKLSVNMNSLFFGAQKNKDRHNYRNYKKNTTLDIDYELLKTKVMNRTYFNKNSTTSTTSNLTIDSEKSQYRNLNMFLNRKESNKTNKSGNKSHTYSNQFYTNELNSFTQRLNNKDKKGKQKIFFFFNKEKQNNNSLFGGKSKLKGNM